MSTFKVKKVTYFQFADIRNEFIASRKQLRSQHARLDLEFKFISKSK